MKIFTKLIGNGALLGIAVFAVYDLSSLLIYFVPLLNRSIWVVLPYLLAGLLSIKLYNAQNYKWGIFAAVYSCIIAAASYVVYGMDFNAYLSLPPLILLVVVIPLAVCNILVEWEKVAGIVRNLLSVDIKKGVVIWTGAIGLLLGVTGYFFSINIPPKRSEAKLKVDPNWESIPGTVVVGSPRPPQNEKLKKYYEYLGNLDKYDPQAIIQSRDYLFKEFTSDPETAQDALRMFIEFYLAVISSCQDLRALREAHDPVLMKIADFTNLGSDPVEKIFSSTDPAFGSFKKENADILEELHNYRVAGIYFNFYTEGTGVELVEDTEFMVSIASGFPGPYAEFIQFYYPQINRPWAHDAGLQITWEDMGRRVAHWEKFMKSHADVPESKTIVEPHLDRMVQIFTGKIRMDNTPVVERNGAMSPGLKKAYESFLENNRDSRYFSAVKQAYEEFKAKEPKRDLGFDAIQSKINSAVPNETVEISPGRYNVDAGNGLTISSKKGLRITAKNGPVEFVSNSAEQVIVRIEASENVILDGVTIYHTVPVACSAACVSIRQSSSVVIQNSDIHGSGAYGVAAWGHDNKNIQILNNKIHNCSYAGVEIHSDGGKISNNTFYDNNRDIDAKDTGDSIRIVISSNVFSKGR